MKKFFTLLLVIMLITSTLIFFGCTDIEIPSSENDTQNDNDNDNNNDDTNDTHNSENDVIANFPVLHVSRELFLMGIDSEGEAYEVGGFGIDFDVWAGERRNDEGNIVDPNELILIVYTLGFESDTGEIDRDLGGYLTDKYVDHFWEVSESERTQLPPLYGAIQFFGITEEQLLAANKAASESGGARKHCPDFLRSMFLPTEEVQALYLNDRGAIFNGYVHNILTLNELFYSDRSAFAEIDLQELVEFQDRLESIGIYRGFNEDLVEFANMHNFNSAVASR